MNWGTKIFISFIVFGAMMITLVVISMRQDVNLVAEDYYEQEIRYQERIDQAENYRNLANKPSVELKKEEGKCMITFPQELLTNGIKGKVHFFRPSDSKQDRIFEMVIEEGNAVSMDIEGMSTGLWLLQVEWEDKEKSYYFEESFHL